MNYVIKFFLFVLTARKFMARLWPSYCTCVKQCILDSFLALPFTSVVLSSLASLLTDAIGSSSCVLLWTASNLFRNRAIYENTHIYINEIWSNRVLKGGLQICW